MTKKKLFIWACDYSENSGEGKLARLFIKNLNYKKKFIFIFNQKEIMKQKYLSTLKLFFADFLAVRLKPLILIP